jgi:Na+-transporting methylmalonyl-CoA/oxaloacetate decarboxylase gamma subunit
VFLLKLVLGIAVFLLFVFVLALLSRVNIMSKQLETIIKEMKESDRELEEAAQAVARKEI